MLSLQGRMIPAKEDELLMARNANCQAMKYLEFLLVRDKHIAERVHSRWLRGRSEASFAAEWFRVETEFDQQFFAALDLGIAA